MKKSKQRAPFFGLQDRMPVVLALLLGFQHALAMLAGIITPPIIIAGSAAFDKKTTQYLVSTSLIVCGILSAVQVTRFHIYKTPYYIGTGLISVVGTSFAIIPIATKGLAQMYANGMCPSASDGTPLPCPKGYGAILGTASLCALLEIGLSFMTPSLLKKLFPPIVTGPSMFPPALVTDLVILSEILSPAFLNGC
jgi:xanthine/uracil permease